MNNYGLFHCLISHIFFFSIICANWKPFLSLTNGKKFIFTMVRMCSLQMRKRAFLIEFKRPKTLVAEIHI